ncbi:MAG: SDR family oxidoreductase [Eubacteriales bacterium]|nr:SDR family oxidoreductase [Eubacteriales bacterium]
MNKTALIIGGGTGIGKCSAIKLAEEGYSIAIVYNSSAAPAEAVKQDILKTGVDCEIFQADVSDDARCREVFSKIEERFGRIDTLVSCAGTTKYIKFRDLDAATDEVWEKLLKVNLIGSFHCCREAARIMKKNGGGSIVLVASTAGVKASGSSIPYGASKAALIHTAKGLAMALAPEIRVNTVSPGIVTGTAWHRDNPDFDAAAADAKESLSIPLGYVTRPEEVADAIVFLATEKSSNITGVDLVLDGGRKEVQNGQIY